MAALSTDVNLGGCETLDDYVTANIGFDNTLALTNQLAYYRTRKL